jgi:hypothetical protein
MISVVLGLSVLVDCIVIFHVCNFWKSPFYCRYNAGFFCELTRIFFWIIIDKSCWFLLKNQLYRQSTAQSLTEDRGR